MPKTSSNRRIAEAGSGAEAGQRARAARGRVQGQHGDDGRHRVDPGDLLLLDQRPEAPAAELAVHHQAGPGGQGGQQADHFGIDVKQRQAAVAAVGGGEPVVRGHARRDVPQLVLGQQDALGGPGRPAGAQVDPAGRPPLAVGRRVLPA
jgi:hypothetical protein